MSVDGVHDPEILGINAASAALAVSDIPWNGPVAAVRVGMIDSQIIVNPTRRELSESLLNLIVTSTNQNMVVMLEASAENVYTHDFQKAIKTGVKECQSIVKAIEDLRAQIGKQKREFTPLQAAPEDLLSTLKLMSENKLRDILRDSTHDKISRDVAVSSVRSVVIEGLKASFPNVDPLVISECFNKFFKELFRRLIFEEDLRYSIASHSVLLFYLLTILKV